MSNSKKENVSRLKYSYSFGQDVVEGIVEKLWRGTNLVARMSDITFNTFCSYLIKLVRQECQVQFEAMKLIIKWADKQDWEDYRHLEPEFRAKYLTYLKYCAHNVVLDRPPAENLGLTWSKVVRKIEEDNDF